MTALTIAPLAPNAQTIADLAGIMVEVVNDGASLHYMAPLDRATAADFWTKSLASAERGERIILGAFDDGALVATVSLLLDTPPNQPHRAEIGKLITRLSHRGRGIARALMLAAQTLAAARGRSLLVLDTAIDGGAAPLYEGLGFQLAGTIPDYAFKPYGGLTGTAIYWKRLGALA